VFSLGCRKWAKSVSGLLKFRLRAEIGCFIPVAASTMASFSFKKEAKEPLVALHFGHFPNWNMADSVELRK
jgi:hypothetical protein